MTRARRIPADGLAALAGPPLPRRSNLARLYRSVEKHRRLGLSIRDAEVEAFCEGYFGDDTEGREATRRAMGAARWRAGVHSGQD